MFLLTTILRIIRATSHRVTMLESVLVMTGFQTLSTAMLEVMLSFEGFVPA